MIEFYPTFHDQIIHGDFPLNHDCILKVFSNHGLRCELFSCRSQDCGTLVDIVSKLYGVTKVSCIPADKYVE